MLHTCAGLQPRYDRTNFDPETVPVTNSEKRGRGNPNFQSDHTPSLSPGERTVVLSVKVPESLRARLEAVPGETLSKKIREALEQYARSKE